MARFLLSNKAVADIGDIWEFTYERWSEEQADHYYMGFLVAFQELADSPRSARNYDEIHHGLQGARVGRHIVFFISLNADEIEIIRILHGRMDLKSRFEEEKR
jgi:toxin ParE1/3/4